MNLRTSSALARMAAQSFPSGDVQHRNDLHDQAVRLLAQLDPAAPAHDGVSRRPAVLTRRRVLLVAGIGVAAVWGSVSVPGLIGPTAYAATAPLLHYTPLDAKETPTNVLDGLAALARSQPPSAGSGPFNYIHTQGWYLDTAQTTQGQILESHIDVADRKLWLAANGAGRIEETRAGQPTSSSGRYEPGGLIPSLVPPGPAEGLQDRLVHQNPGRTTAEWFAMVTDIWNTQAVAPQLQAALLSILSTRPDLRLDGAVTDRAGRPGIAVSIEVAGTPSTRRVLILSPTTGMLLGFEEIALEASDLPVKAPATIGYTLWLSSGHTLSTDTNP